MSAKKANMTDSERYINSMHTMGRLGALFAILIMLAMPVIAGLYFHAMPSPLQVLKAAAGLLAIFIPITVSEVLAYTPVFGSSMYLTLVTGNISNLKLPVTNDVLRALDIEAGTEEADIVSSITVAVSSFITLVVLILGVILILPMRSVLEQPAVKLAAANILPALFGCMAMGLLTPSLGGGITSKGRFKGMIAPAVLILVVNIVLFYFIPGGKIIASSFIGFIMLLALPVAYFGTKALYKSGSIEVYLPGEKPDDTKK
jgi:hypothetical protein